MAIPRWLTNTLNPEEGATRLGIFVTMAALLVASLAVPHAFGADGVIAAAVLGVAIAAALWWAYFDVVALVAERRLAARQGEERARMARDSYTFLHLPMVAGIVLVVLIPVTRGLDALPALAITALATCGLIAYEAIRFRDARDRVRHAQEVAVS